MKRWAMIMRVMVWAAMCVTLSAWAYEPPPSSGIYLWMKADAITGKSDGDQVGSSSSDKWLDSSANNRNFYNRSLTNYVPTYIADATPYRPLPAVKFRTGNKYLASDSNNPGVMSNITMFAVVRVVGPDVTGYIVGQEGVGGSGPSCFTLGLSGGALTWSIQKDGAPDVVATISDTEDLTDGEAWHFLAGVYDRSDGTMKAYVNQWNVNNPAVSGTGPTGFIFDKCIGIGAAAYWWGGFKDYGSATDIDVAEILIYDAVLSSSDFAAVYGYLEAKYGPPKGTAVMVQ